MSAAANGPDAPLLFERSRAGRRAARPPQVDGPPVEELLDGAALRSAPPQLPEVSELDLVRHFTQLAHRQFSIDGNVYPLGSCTMKYNPKVHEDAAALFADVHPYQDPEGAQGVMTLLGELQEDLTLLTGMDDVTLQPAAGAHGELAGILMIRAFHSAAGEDEQRRVVIVPDAAHGTNPATARMVGYNVVEVA
ncbi:MAG: aminomethyl-transferring glycine dehydrogenase subunit GcvPB, partial [Trueperaceae bacterium]